MAELIKPGYDDTADIADINSNTDEFAARIANCKPKQTAKTSPTASGTASQFIDTVSQDANGVITATKKTVRTMTGATSSAAGATGLVPAPTTGDVGKYLKGDGTWGTPPNTTYSEATSSAYGLVKIGYTASGKNYPVQLSSGKMFVNVPWTDNNTTYSAATSSALGLIKIGYTASGKKYPVQLDSSNKAYVEVPWTDTNTTYSTFSGATANAAGTSGLVPAPAAGKHTSFLKGDGTWGSPAYPGTASSGTAGLIKIGYTTSAANRNYAVQLDANNKAFVNVPWTDNNTTYSAGIGLSLSNNQFSVSKANVSTMINLLDVGDANSVAADYLVTQYSNGGTSNTGFYRRRVDRVVNGTVVKAALGTNSTHGGAFLRKDGTWQVPPGTNYGAATTDAYGLIKIGFTTSASDRNYAVKLSSGKAYVNVPWVAYTAATQSAGGLMSAADKIKLDGIDAGAQVNPGIATSSTAGLIKIGKTFDATNCLWPVQLDSSSKAFVSIPFAKVSSGQIGIVKLGTVTGNRQYPLKTLETTDITNGTAYVEVPWTNTWRGFSVQSFNYQYTVSANSTKNITGTNFGVGKTGYTPVAVCLFNPGSTDVHVIALDINATGSNTVMTVKNMTGSSITATAYIEILYLQNS